MLEAIAAALPKRPLILKDPSTTLKGKGAFFLALLLFAAVGLAAVTMSWTSLFPDIKKDWVISKDAEEFNPSAQFATPFQSAAPITGECKSFGVVLEDCDITVSYRDSMGQPQTRAINMTFLDVSLSDYSVAAVRSASNHDLVSVDLAVDNIWNRIIVMLLIMLFGLLMFAMIPFLLRQNTATRKKILNLSGRGDLIPVAVKITSHTTAHKTHNVKYTVDFGSGEKKFSTNLGKQKPFMLGGDGKEALGLTAPGQEYAFLVDEKLTRLELSEAEREAVRQARDKALRPENDAFITF